MKRWSIFGAVVLLLSILFGFWLGHVALAANHPSYPRTGGSCKKGYHGVTATHKVKGKSKRYVECVWTVVPKPVVITTLPVPTTLAPVPTTQPAGNTGVPTTTTTIASLPPAPPLQPQPQPSPTTTTTQPVVTTTSTTQPPVTTSTSTTTTSTTTTTLAPQTINVTVTMDCSGGNDNCTIFNSSAETTAGYTDVYAGNHNDDESPGAGTVTFISTDNKTICTGNVRAGIASNNGECTGGADGSSPYAGPITVNYSGATVYDASTNTTTIYSTATTTGHSN